jgi:hypothetical protein
MQCTARNGPDHTRRDDGAHPVNAARGAMTDFRQRNRRLLDAALKAADQGWFVFPLRPGHKTPALRHHWERRATRDPAALHRWFAATPFNIGIATGPSNLIVVDLDPPPPAPVGTAEAAHGRQSLVRLAWQHRQVVPADTFTVLTPPVIHGRRQGLFTVHSEGGQPVPRSSHHGYLGVLFARIRRRRCGAAGAPDGRANRSRLAVS